ncbi:MAG: AraC family transcriptional regulator [Fusobacteriaceae bacterium]|nr:AraC family transcriptional regulator [Fusobacteriaceae bacterium]MBP6467224.1 AraC family transcriptional regulator [Fusobacteriaceae bacterium]MBP9595773.1 AraC family transcriptional regulator [Fusobacteriaceae bacterium]
MSNQIEEYINELSKIIDNHIKKDGSFTTEVPSLFFNRVFSNIGPQYATYRTSFCFTVQGEKEIVFGQETLRYGVGDYLITSIDVPVMAKVIKGPYVSIKLEFTTDEILKILDKVKKNITIKKEVSKTSYISKIDLDLLNALVRLVRLVDTPEDVSTLAPLFKEEILYRLLKSEFGSTLEQITVKGSKSYLVRDVIRKIMENFNQPIKVEELAEIANMSPASLHRYFKDVTTMSPIQFQKQVRLQEARRLLLSEPTDATDVAFRVGYESPSQFSREYSRLFGFPPIEDIKNLKNGALNNKFRLCSI